MSDKKNVVKKNERNLNVLLNLQLEYYVFILYFNTLILEIIINSYLCTLWFAIVFKISNILYVIGLKIIFFNNRLSLTIIFS